MLDIDAVRFTIACWEAGHSGVAAAPVPYARELWADLTREKVHSSLRVQRLTTTRLQIFKRLDGFPCA